MSKMTIDDPHVCEKGITSLLEALKTARAEGLAGKPKFVVVSTNGISKAGWDFPVLMVPFYRYMLKVPHEDKKVLEEKVVASGEPFEIVRRSMLVDGESEKKIRVGIEDWDQGLEKKAVGYTISREDTGRWIFDSLLQETHPEYWRKIVSITY